MSAAGAGKRPPALSGNLILRRVINAVVKLAVAAYLLAYLLSFTSASPLWNLPAAILAVAAFRWMSSRVVVRPGARGAGGADARRRRQRRFGGSAWHAQKPAGGVDRDAWRRGVNAPIVASAWDALCGSIIQEFVYDTWYMSLTPDREFPAEVRRLLNGFFADLAQRARKIDLRAVLLGELCNLFSDYLDLYRTTKVGVGLVHEGHLTPAARDRAFQLEMRTESTLHPSFHTRDGHYRVIRGIAEGIVSHSVSKLDLDRPYIKALARELIATCVLRPAIMYFNPYNASRIVLSLYPEELEQIQAKISKRMEEMVGKKDLADGHFEFEERARRAAELEVKAHKKSRHRASGIPLHHRKEASSAEDSGAEVPLMVGKPRILDSPHEGEYPLNAEDASWRDDIASEASSAITEQRSVASEPLSSASAFSPTLQSSACRASDIALSGRAGSPPVPVLGPPMDSSSSLPFSNFEMSNEGPSSFVGWPRARVVAPEFKVVGSKEYVVFKIRVADDEGEWTVARRYRNFEALHKKLRDIAEYRNLGAKLPPKRYLLHFQTTEFVEERRVALDKYLQSVLSSSILASHPEVLNFLCKQHTSRYRPDADMSLLSTVANNADSVKHSLKTAVEDVLVEGKVRWSGRYKSPEKQPVPCGPPKGSVPQASPNEALHQNWSTGNMQALPHVQVRQQDPRLSQTGQQSVLLSPRALSDSSGPPSARNTPSGTPSRDASPARAGRVPRLPLSSSMPTGRSDMQQDFAGAKVVDLKASTTSADGCLPDAATRSPVGHDASLGGGGLRSSEVYQEASSLGRHRHPDDDDFETDWDAELEDYAGISAPLYQVVERVFDIPAQKFFRRQVFQAVRQLLSLLAGDLIDVYLKEQFKSMRTEHTIARLIHQLKNALWPGGKWFGSLGPFAEARAALNKGGRPKGIDRDKYLEPLLRPPDEEEMAERLRHRLITQANPVFTRLLGKSTYLKGIQDLYDMLQLPTFMTQLGYGVVEIVVLALYPELEDLFGRIHDPGRKGLS
eukprot:evm.model.scf_463.2 EVM.evm.TU.scf_463.2   scf_463:20967-31329(+)